MCDATNVEGVSVLEHPLKKDIYPGLILKYDRVYVWGERIDT